MQQTENYQLNKIELADSPADITVLNSNWDKLDDELNRKRYKTIDVLNANLNELLADKSYACTGTITNAPIPCSFCILQAFDTGAEISGVITQVCYVPQTDHTVRSFLRSVANGTTFGTWNELIGSSVYNDTTARLDRLIEENTFRSRALCKALQNDVSFLVVECFENNSDINTDVGDGELVANTMFNQPYHSIDKTGENSVTFQSLAKVNTKSNLQAWAWVDTVGTGTCKIEISRDNGTTFTTIPNDNMVSINSQPSGVSLICRLTLSGDIILKNISWGVK